jgi:hypothetical protein
LDSKLANTQIVLFLRRFFRGPLRSLRSQYAYSSFFEKVFSAALCVISAVLCGNAYFTAERAEIRREPQRRNMVAALLRGVASAKILFFLRRFSLRISAVLCGNAYFTAECAEIRRGPQRRNMVAALLRGVASAQILLFLRRFSLRISAVLCGNGFFTAECAEIRRGPQSRENSVAALLRGDSAVKKLQGIIAKRRRARGDRGRRN